MGVGVGFGGVVVELGHKEGWGQVEGKGIEGEAGEGLEKLL